MRLVLKPCIVVSTRNLFDSSRLYRSLYGISCLNEGSSYEMFYMCKSQFDYMCEILKICPKFFFSAGDVIYCHICIFFFFHY